MRAKSVLEIRQVENGYMVRSREDASIGSHDNIHVFQTMKELYIFLCEHFDYRSPRSITND